MTMEERSLILLAQKVSKCCTDKCVKQHSLFIPEKYDFKNGTLDVKA